MAGTVESIVRSWRIQVQLRKLQRRRVREREDLTTIQSLQLLESIFYQWQNQARRSGRETSELLAGVVAYQSHRSTRNAFQAWRYYCKIKRETAKAKKCGIVLKKQTILQVPISICFTHTSSWTQTLTMKKKTRGNVIK